MHYYRSVGFHLDDFLADLSNEKSHEISNGEFAQEVWSQPDVALDPVASPPITPADSKGSGHHNNGKCQTFSTK